MIVIWGQRMYGRVDRIGGTHVATRFFHFYYLPLIPLSSWLVLEEQDGGKFLGLQVPLQLRSVLTAWLRLASVVAVLSAGFGMLSHAGSATSTIMDGLFSSTMFGFWSVIAFFAFFRMGRLSREQKAARGVYWDYTGKFVDVGLLGDGRGPIKQRTIEELDRHMVKHATASYREAPQTSWRAIATRPDQRDVPLLRAALTRCRIEWSEVTGPEKQALDADHQAIFANLVAASPEIVETSDVP